MTHKVTFKETEDSIRGFVDDYLVIHILCTNVTTTSPKKDWIIQTSSCLPADLEWAKAYVETMTTVIQCAEAKTIIEKKGVIK